MWHGKILGGNVSAIDKVAIMLDGSTINAKDCCTDPFCDECSSTEEILSPINFQIVQSDLLELSLYWSSLPNTHGSKASTEFIHSLILTCSPSNAFNHFTEISLYEISSLTIDCPSDASVIIDYTSDTNSIQNMGITLTGGIDESRIIHHFTASSLTVSGINVLGAIFAPWSDLYFPQGLITGQVIAGAFVGGESSFAVSAALNDDCGQYGSGHAIVTDATGPLVLEQEPQAIFVQNPDGTGVITGRAKNEQGTILFDVEVLLSSYSTITPPDSPKEELLSSCYAANGGTVDPSNWEYYEGITGTLTAVSGSIYEGAVLNLQRMGPSAQVGEGANGKNVENGLSFWFTFDLLVQSTGEPLPDSGVGDFNLDSTSISSTVCPSGQINFNPFAGCVPSFKSLVCCLYENNSILNHFCTSHQCEDIPGWNLLEYHSVSSCTSCSSCPAQ